jgi:hypothetical protein
VVQYDLGTACSGDLCCGGPAAGSGDDPRGVFAAWGRRKAAEDASADAKRLVEKIRHLPKLYLTASFVGLPFTALALRG